MRRTPPAVGVIPLPIQENGLGINKLLEILFQANPPGVLDTYPPEEVTLYQCDACPNTICLSAGYVFMDDFYCERCFWELARKGRFCDDN